MRYKEYIPSPQLWKDDRYYAPLPFHKVVERFPIQKIKRKTLRNKVDTNEVLHIVMNFSQEAWIPVTLNRRYYLIDGQHRLAAAAQLCLKYIDIVIQ